MSVTFSDQEFEILQQASVLLSASAGHEDLESQAALVGALRLLSVSSGEKARAILGLLIAPLEEARRQNPARGTPRPQLLRIVDLLRVPCLILGPKGRIRQRSRAFVRRFEGTALERPLCEAAVALAREVTVAENGSGGSEQLSTRVAEAGDTIVLQAVVIDDPPSSDERAALVAVRPVEADLPSIETVRSRFGLTDRQAEIALLVARRLSNREIARTLSISYHTARHHVGLVLRKLDVGSRKDVRRRLCHSPNGQGGP